MTLAIWDITTITSVAANTHFGVIGRWEEIPDMYPPIGFMFTSTTPAARAQRSSYGLFLEFECSTSNTVAAAAPGSGMVKHVPIRVLSYQKGTRWFRIQAPLYDDVYVGASAIGEMKSNCANATKRLVLYYRAQDETGEVPA